MFHSPILDGIFQDVSELVRGMDMRDNTCNDFWPKRLWKTHQILSGASYRGDRNFAPDNGPIYRTLGNSFPWAFRDGRFNLAKPAKMASSLGMILFLSYSGLFSRTVIAHGRTREWIPS